MLYAVCLNHHAQVTMQSIKEWKNKTNSKKERNPQKFNIKRTHGIWVLNGAIAPTALGLPEPDGMVISSCRKNH